MRPRTRAISIADWRLNVRSPVFYPVMDSIWRVVILSEVITWMKDLNQQDKVRVAAALNVLEREGPSLGRPLVDGIRGSRHPRMKELRVGTLRLLFAFDPA